MCFKNFLCIFFLHNANTVSGLKSKPEECFYSRQDIFQIKILCEYTAQ